MTNETFIHFARCAKAGFLFKKKPELKDTGYENRRDVQHELRAISIQLFKLYDGAENATILDNIKFETKFGESAVAEIVIRTSLGSELIGVVINPKEIDFLEIQNIAYTYNIAKKSGTVFNRVSVLKLRNDYVLGEEITCELIRVEDCTKKVIQLQPRIEKMIESFKSRIRNNSTPDNKIDYYCNRPTVCPFKSFCISKEFPESSSIMELKDISYNRMLQLFRSGILLQKDIAPNFILSDKSKKQILYTELKKPIIARKKIREWLNVVSSRKQIWFLDFEYDGPIIPPFPNNKALTNYPFMFTLRHINLENGSEGYFQYLITTKLEASNQIILVEELIKTLKLIKDVKIIVGNIKRTKECLDNLSASLPEKMSDLKVISTKLVDIQQIFRDHLYYQPEFKGSSYLKDIAPIICPEVSYKSIAIMSGAEARHQFRVLHLMQGTDPINTENELRRYGLMDTFALLQVFKFLRKI